MGIEGALSLQSVSLKEAVVSMADFFDFYELDISGESGDHIVDGYLIVKDKWDKCVAKAFHNTNASTTATIIVQTSQGGDVDKTIKVPAEGYTPKLPAITKIKVAGTSNDLVVFVQKRI